MVVLESSICDDTLYIFFLLSTAKNTFYTLIYKKNAAHRSLADNKGIKINKNKKRTGRWTLIKRIREQIS